MIDEKKITEAINTYIGYAKEGIETSMRRDAFRVGVKWFKKAIWHDAKEEPKEHKCILVQWINKGRICYETYTKENIVPIGGITAPTHNILTTTMKIFKEK